MTSRHFFIPSTFHPPGGASAAPSPHSRKRRRKEISRSSRGKNKSGKKKRSKVFPLGPITRFDIPCVSSWGCSEVFCNDCKPVLWKVLLYSINLESGLYIPSLSSYYISWLGLGLEETESLTFGLLQRKDRRKRSRRDSPSRPGDK